MNQLQKITAEMLRIEKANMEYNKATDFGKNPNGKEDEIAKSLLRWDVLKVERNKLKTTI